MFKMHSLKGSGMTRTSVCNWCKNYNSIDVFKQEA